MNNSKKLSRRSFIQHASALPFMKYASAVTGSALLGSHASAADCIAGQPKSLVCIFLLGGADSFNFVIPGGNQYDQYAATRRELAIPSGQLLSANDTQRGEFSFNRELPNLHSLYGNNKLSVVANVGTLTRPTTASDFTTSTALPQSLFAHNAQQKLWQTGSGNLADAFGWGGSIAQQLANCNRAAAVDSAISVNGSNTWLNNRQNNYVTLSANATVDLMQGHVSSSRTRGVLETLLAQEQTQGSPIESAVASGISRAVTTTEGLRGALAANPLIDFSPQGRFEQQLHLVARLISAREQLNMGRQVFFVGLGGWDTHSNQLERFSPLLGELDSGLGKFQAAIEDLNKSNSVTTFTASDFGRSLTSNGDGTDHGWGGHAFVLGGAVDGGKLVGEFPSFANVDNPDDAGNRNQFAGRIIPKISVSQYGATLGSWMGLSDTELDLVMPNLSNFGTKNLGFMKS